MSYRPIGGRRNRSAAWQWVVIGFIPGLFCGLCAMIGVIAEGTLLQFVVPTPEPRVVTTVVHVVMTATEDPAALPPTPFPQIVIVTATSDAAQAAAALRSVAVATQAAPQSVAVAATGIPSEPVSAPARAAAADVPEALRAIRSLAVTVPGGSYMMGTTVDEVIAAVDECKNVYQGSCEASYAEDSFPAHPVAVDAFQMETTEVTFQQVVAFLNSRGPGTHLNGCAGFPCIETRNESPDALILYDGANYSVQGINPQYPAYGMTWYGAREYCEAIGRRLPSEAEWERAARGDEGLVYPWGNAWNPDLAKTSRSTDTTQGPLAVGSYPLGASVYGVNDLAGNLAEWTADWYDENYYKNFSLDAAAQNPRGPLQGLEKTLRGGSFNSVPFFARAVHRQSWDPSGSQRWIGFRCAADLTDTSAVASGDLNAATLGLDIPEQPPAETAIPNAQPTMPPES